MQAIVSMRDAQDGGNLHSQQLDHAFDAIRESKDFCGEFGNIDANALGRMVIVHETTALKQQDVTRISALEATESYLDFSREQLTLAAGGVREASQALLLLGQIELQMAKPADTHSTSVAVAVQQAAVESDPYFAVGYRVLGATLLSLGMAEEASNCLITSLQIQPTRLAYERLLDASRRLGDADTARICMASLQDPRMDEGDLVYSLTPSEFAATHRPAPASIQPAQSAANREAVKAQAEPVARISFGSLFPFSRR
jgi:tetratricopeptide (TPR) repeat protein